MIRLRQKFAFKKIVAVVAAVVMVFVTFPTISGTRAEAQTVAELQEELNQLQKDKDKLSSRLESLGDDISEEEEKLEGYKEVMSNVKAQLSVYQKQIDAVNAEIMEKNNQIDAKNKQIAATNAEISEKEALMKETDELFKERLTAMYVSAGDSSVLSVLFGAESFSDFLTRAEVMKNIADRDSALMDQLAAQKQELQKLRTKQEEAKAEIETQKAEIEKKKADIVALQANVKTKSNEYNSLISESKSIISGLEKKQQTTEANIASLQKEDAYIQQMIQAAQKPAEEEKKESESNTSSAGNQGSSSSSSTPSSRGYIWPVPGYSYVSTEFNTSGSLWASGYHSGLDMAAPSGTPIYACRSGTVTIAKDGCYNGDRWANGGYGNYIVIDHGDGYQTLYAHIRRGDVKVSVGQKVSQGQLIALVGTTGNSTGNHLHLEVRYHGVCQNPRNYVREP